MNQTHPTISQPNLSRREVLALIAKLSTGAALLPILAACDASGSGYDDQVKLIWERPFTKEPDLNGQILEIVRYATLAPSGHNTQPWKFSVTDNTIRLLPDYARRLPAVDPDDRELFISLGCALENLVIAARQAGYDSETTYFPSNEQECIVIRLTGTSTKSDSVLFDAIPQRQCTRNEYNKQTVPLTNLKKLDEVSKDRGISARLFTDAKQIEQLVEYVKAGDKRQFGDGAFVEELVKWIRFNDEEAVKYRDGLFTRCTGNPSVPRWLGEIFLRLSGTDAQANTDEKNIRSAAGMMLFVSERNDKTGWLDTGRVYERVALTAAALNIKTAFMNQPAEVPELRSQLQSYLNLGSSSPQLLLRFGDSEPMPRSLRRPVKEILA